MSRRYRNKSDHNILDSIVDVSSLLPWWITLPVAAMLFFFVPYDASTSISVEQPTDVIGVAISLIASLFFKYLVPIALVIGAVMHIATALKSLTLFNSISGDGAQKTITKLDWRDFEFLLTEWFKKQGYAVERTGGHGADGGIDIKLHKDGGLYLVQCKHYRAWKVGVHVVRELFGVMVAERAEGGFVVTSGQFTHESKAFAEGKNIMLFDGDTLAGMLEQSDIDLESMKVDVGTHAAGVCPRCGAQLVRRTGKHGPFIGCSSYPKCRYTASID